MKKVYTLVFREGVFITDKAHSFVEAMRLAELENYQAHKLQRAGVWRDKRKSARSINFITEDLAVHGEKI